MLNARYLWLAVEDVARVIRPAWESPETVETLIDVNL